MKSLLGTLAVSIILAGLSCLTIGTAICLRTWSWRSDGIQFLVVGAGVVVLGMIEQAYERYCS